MLEIDDNMQLDPVMHFHKTHSDDLFNNINTGDCMSKYVIQSRSYIKMLTCITSVFNNISKFEFVLNKLFNNT